MSLELLTWDSRTPYEAGYEHLVGRARIALDPDHKANHRIVDLDRARRDDDGLVRFEADVVLLRAPEPGTLLHVVANRGLVTGLPYGEAGGRDADGTIEVGDGWVLRRGLSVLWVGWQWDIERRPGAVGLDAPQAVDGDGVPIPGQARLEFRPLVDVAVRRLADDIIPQVNFKPLKVRDLDDAGAVLTERTWFNGPRRVIPRDQWHFTDHEHLERDGGFRGRNYYEVTYTTSDCPVVGAGLTSVRDVVAGIKSDYAAALTMGISQSGRWLRQFLFDTANVDESGQRVFDGVHVHIGGGRRGEFNHRYAQPSTTDALSFTHLPPYSPADGLIDDARAAGTAPRILFTNSATEYWRGDASLVHPVPDGEEWRAYLYAGAHHSGQMPGRLEALPVQFKQGNMVEILWPMRAHIAALEEWVRDGVEPPASAVPQRGDGTGISREELLQALGHFDGIRFPDPATFLGLPPLDLGPDADHGIGVFPPKATGPNRPCLVSALDDDGNEIAGVRLPEVAVPLAATFGWNPEQPRGDVPVEVWPLIGGRRPFAVEEIVRRYGDRDGYLTQVRAALDALVAARHVLAEDVDEMLRRAGDRYDEETAGASGR